jgi:hypothetical protein
MRSLRLIRVAIEAEQLRLRHQARRLAKRAVSGCIAAMLLLGALVFLHIAAWFWLRDYLAGQYVALIFAAIDMVCGLIFALLAARSDPGQVELEALALRRQALDDASASLTVSALLLRLLQLLMTALTRR